MLAWRVFDSSTGFRLPDGSVLSPDAAVVRLERWEALTSEQRRSFPLLCPDLVVELVRPSDEGPHGITALRHRMAVYRAKGATLGWLLLPEQRAVEIWNQEKDSPQRLEQVDTQEAVEALAGLKLELVEIWQG